MVSIQVYIKTKTNMITSRLYQQQHNNVNCRQKGQKGRLEMKNKMILSKRGLVQFYDWLSNKRRHVYTNVHRNRTGIAWRRREKRRRTIYWTEHFNYFEPFLCNISKDDMKNDVSPFYSAYKHVSNLWHSSKWLLIGVTVFVLWGPNRNSAFLWFGRTVYG